MAKQKWYAEQGYDKAPGIGGMLQRALPGGRSGWEEPTWWDPDNMSISLKKIGRNLMKMTLIMLIITLDLHLQWRIFLMTMNIGQENKGKWESLLKGQSIMAKVDNVSLKRKVLLIEKLNMVQLLAIEIMMGGLIWKMQTLIINHLLGVRHLGGEIKKR